ncbi:MAG: hypothetical protein U0325_31000 [Polyangiales bacterium]
MAQRPSPVATTPPRAPLTARDAAPEAATFTLDFTPSTARISLDDRVIGAGHASVRVPRDGRSHTLRVEAPGFVPVHDVLRASGDVQISRPLEVLDAGAPARPTPVARPTTSAATAPRGTPPPVQVPHRRPIDPTYPE